MVFIVTFSARAEDVDVEKLARAAGWSALQRAGLYRRRSGSEYSDPDRRRYNPARCKADQPAARASFSTSTSSARALNVTIKTIEASQPMRISGPFYRPESRRLSTSTTSENTL